MNKEELLKELSLEEECEISFIEDNMDYASWYLVTRKNDPMHPIFGFLKNDNDNIEKFLYTHLDQNFLEYQEILFDEGYDVMNESLKDIVQTIVEKRGLTNTLEFLSGYKKIETPSMVWFDCRINLR